MCRKTALDTVTHARVKAPPSTTAVVTVTVAVSIAVSIDEDTDVMDVGNLAGLVGLAATIVMIDNVSPTRRSRSHEPLLNIRQKCIPGLSHLKSKNKIW